MMETPSEMGPAAFDGHGRHPGVPRLSLWTYLALLARHRRLVVLVPAAVGLAAGALAFSKQREYVADAQIVIEDAEAPSGLAQLTGQLGLSLGTQRSGKSPDHFAELLRSREALRSLVETEFTPDGERGFGGSLYDYFGVDRAESDALREVVEATAGLIEARVNARIGTISVSVRTTVPTLSREIVERLLLLVDELESERKTRAAREEREFYEERLGESRTELQDAEDALVEFSSQNRVVGSPRLFAEQARLQRQVELRQQLYLAVSGGYEAARLEEVRTPRSLSVFEGPEGFVRPVSRGTVRHAIVGGLAGFFGVLLLIFIVEFMADTRATPTPEFEAFLREMERGRS